MKRIQFLLFISLTGLIACGDSDKSEDGAADKDSAVATSAVSKVKEENVTYKDDTTTLNGFVAFDENSGSKRPAVLVIPEWWGLNEYPKMRARELAKLGYIAMAMDMYGNGLITDSPSTAGKLAT